jgi:hypothetical protein
MAMAVGDVLFATISVALLIRTLVGGEASLLLIVEVESLLAGCWLMPVGERRGVILVSLSGSVPFPGGGTRSHGSFSLSLGSILFVNFAAGRRASMKLSNRAPGWFNSAMRGLTFLLRGDLERWSDLRPWQGSTEEGAMAASALPIGFSLVFEEHIAMAMVEEYRRVGLTLTVVRSQLKKNNKLVLILPTAQLLARARAVGLVLSVGLCLCVYEFSN